MLSRFSAADTYIAKVFFNKRNATRFNTAGFFLQILLTFNVTTPHSLNKARTILCYIKELFLRGSNACLFSKVLLCSLVKFIMNVYKCLLDLLNNIIKRYKHLFTTYTANKYTRIILDITRTNLKTKRNALHLVLAILPTGRVITVIKLNSELLGKKLTKLVSLFKYAFLVLSNRNNSNLNRSNLWRKNKSVIITVSHNNSTYHTC